MSAYDEQKLVSLKGPNTVGELPNAVAEHSKSSPLGGEL